MPRNRNDIDDDGRTIADMSVDGMPDSMGGMVGSYWIPSGWKRKKSDVQPPKESLGYMDEAPLTKKETRMVVLNAIIGALGVALIFIAAFVLFILFCVYVWFR